MTEQQRENLITSMNQLLADTAVFRQKAQAYHWNVTGLLFGELHEQFQEIYEDLAEPYDGIAEQIRVLGAFPNTSLQRYAQDSVLSDPVETPGDPVAMIENLYEDNERILNVISEIENLAEQADAQGLLDFVNGRHQHHNMIRYKLGSHLAVNTPDGYSTSE